jgi:hypothetical protein
MIRKVPNSPQSCIPVTSGESMTSSVQFAVLSEGLTKITEREGASGSFNRCDEERIIRHPFGA